MLWRGFDTFAFGDNPALAESLAALVLDGRKRATCWAASDGMQTELGKRTVMLDGSGRPRAVLETTQLFACRFDQFADDMLLWCERFHVVERIAGPHDR